MRINKLPRRLIIELEQTFKNEKHGKQRTIYQAVWLLSKGWNREKTAEVVGLSPDRIRQLVTLYYKGGLVNLRLKLQSGNNHVLTIEQKEQIKKLLQTQKYWSIYLLKQLVKREFNLTYKDQDSYRRLLIWCGYSFHKANSLWYA